MTHIRVDSFRRCFPRSPGHFSTLFYRIKPAVKLCQTVYQKGISLSKKAMLAIEARLERNPILPKWDILIRPA
ncbi:MAG: hypothetical protein PHO08_06730 [Methylococcales bacterium]|nr:hypothetical protein [Methylococcales bacterium]